MRKSSIGSLLLVLAMIATFVLRAHPEWVTGKPYRPQIQPAPTAQPLPRVTPAPGLKPLPPGVLRPIHR